MQIYISYLYISSNKEYGFYIIFLLHWILYYLSIFTFKYWIINAIILMKSVFYIHIDIRVPHHVTASSFIWSISERLK